MYAHLDPLIDQISQPDWLEKADTCWKEDLGHLSWKDLVHVAISSQWPEDATEWHAESPCDVLSLKDLFEHCRTVHPGVVRKLTKQLKTTNCKVLQSTNGTEEVDHISKNPGFSVVLDALASKGDILFEMRGELDFSILLEPHMKWWKHVSLCGETRRLNRVFEVSDASALEALSIVHQKGSVDGMGLARSYLNAGKVHWRLTRFELNGLRVDAKLSRFRDSRSDSQAFSFGDFIVGDDVIRDLVTILGHSTCRLTSLTVGYGVWIRDGSELWTSLGECASLTHLQWSCPPRQLWEALRTNLFLQTIEVTFLCNDKVGELAPFLASVSRKSKLERLVLSTSCPEGVMSPDLDNVGPALTDLLAHSSLKSFHFGDHQYRCWYHLPVDLGSLASNNHLRKLMLTIWSLDGMQFSDLAQALVHNTSLLDVRVQLKGRKLEQTVWYSLARGVAANATLRRLHVDLDDLCRPVIEWDDLNELWRALARNTSLVSLMFDQAQPKKKRPDAIPAYEHMLDTNLTLQTLYPKLEHLDVHLLNAVFDRKRVYESDLVTEWIAGMERLRKHGGWRVLSDHYFYLVRSQPDWIQRLKDAGSRKRKTSG